MLKHRAPLKKTKKLGNPLIFPAHLHIYYILKKDASLHSHYGMWKASFIKSVLKYEYSIMLYESIYAEYTYLLPFSPYRCYSLQRNTASNVKFTITYKLYEHSHMHSIIHKKQKWVPVKHVLVLHIPCRLLRHLHWLNENP